MTGTLAFPGLPGFTASAAILPGRIVAFSGTTAPTVAHAVNSGSRILGVTPNATKYPTDSREDNGNAFNVGDMVSILGVRGTIAKVELGAAVTALLTPLTATANGRAAPLTIAVGTVNTYQWQLGYALQVGAIGELIDVLIDIIPHAAFAS